MLWCIDLDQTITAFPNQMKALMAGLRAQGCQVVVLCGHPAPSVDPQVIADKQALLSSLDLNQGVDYDNLIAVSDPVPDMKVAYMRHADAAALVDNNKRNVKAARKAGFMALHVG